MQVTAGKKPPAFRVPMLDSVCAMEGKRTKCWATILKVTLHDEKRKGQLAIACPALGIEFRSLFTVCVLEARGLRKERFG